MGPGVGVVVDRSQRSGDSLLWRSTKSWGWGVRTSEMKFFGVSEVSERTYWRERIGVSKE